MIILGLTGSIGMGKTVTAGMFRHLGVAVHDADVAVHRFLGSGGAAVAEVEAAFPGVAKGGAIDRAVLGRRVFGDAEALRCLEGILHPMVGRDRDRFLRQVAIRRGHLAILDIPLLFEIGGGASCDAVVVVTAPAFLQRMRVLARPGMTEERLAAILARQVPDAEKRRRADFIVQTGLGRGYALRCVQEIITVTRGISPRVWPRGLMKGP